MKSYTFSDFGYSDAISGERIQYLVSVSPATEENSCKDAKLAPLKD